MCDVTVMSTSFAEAMHDVQCPYFCLTRVTDWILSECERGRETLTFFFRVTFSVMTLTHVSGVSGLSESPAGIQEEPLGPADEDPEEEQKQSENDVLREQLEEMRQTLADVQQQLAE